MASKKESCLVTGGAGFIGSHLADALVKRGYTVRVLDNLSTGKVDNLKQVRGKIEFVKGDIRRPADCRKAVKGIDYVFHFAANRAVLRSVEHPLATNNANVTGTLTVLDAARVAGVPRVVCASSSSVYGGAEILPTPESAPRNRVSPTGG